MESTGYTLARANRLRNIHFPSVQEPENIQFLWFNVDLDDDSMYPNMHTHSFFEIIFVIYGKATHEYMGKKVVLCEKDAILIPPNINASLLLFPLIMILFYKI